MLLIEYDLVNVSSPPPSIDRVAMEATGGFDLRAFTMALREGLGSHNVHVVVGRQGDLLCPASVASIENELSGEPASLINSFVALPRFERDRAYRRGKEDPFGGDSTHIGWANPTIRAIFEQRPAFMESLCAHCRMNMTPCGGSAVGTVFSQYQLGTSLCLFFQHSTHLAQQRTKVFKGPDQVANLSSPHGCSLGDACCQRWGLKDDQQQGGPAASSRSLNVCRPDCGFCFPVVRKKGASAVEYTFTTYNPLSLSVPVSSDLSAIILKHVQNMRRWLGRPLLVGCVEEEEIRRAGGRGLLVNLTDPSVPTKQAERQIAFAEKKKGKSDDRVYVGRGSARLPILERFAPPPAPISLETAWILCKTAFAEIIANPKKSAFFTKRCLDIVAAEREEFPETFSQLNKIWKSKQDFKTLCAANAASLISASFTIARPLFGPYFVGLSQQRAVGRSEECRHVCITEESSPGANMSPITPIPAAEMKEEAAVIETGLGGVCVPTTEEATWIEERQGQLEVQAPPSIAESDPVSIEANLHVENAQAGGEPVEKVAPPNHAAVMEVLVEDERKHDEEAAIVEEIPMEEDPRISVFENEEVLIIDQEIESSHQEPNGSPSQPKRAHILGDEFVATKESEASAPAVEGTLDDVETSSPPTAAAPPTTTKALKGPPKPSKVIAGIPLQAPSSQHTSHNHSTTSSKEVLVRAPSPVGKKPASPKTSETLKPTKKTTTKPTIDSSTAVPFAIPAPRSLVAPPAPTSKKAVVKHEPHTKPVPVFKVTRGTIPLSFKDTFVKAIQGDAIPKSGPSPVEHHRGEPTTMCPQPQDKATGDDNDQTATIAHTAWPKNAAPVQFPEPIPLSPSKSIKATARTAQFAPKPPLTPPPQYDEAAARRRATETMEHLSLRERRRAHQRSGNFEAAVSSQPDLFGPQEEEDEVPTFNPFTVLNSKSPDDRSPATLQVQDITFLPVDYAQQVPQREKAFMEHLNNNDDDLSELDLPIDFDSLMD